MAKAERGFRSLDHTADKSIEAWGPTLDDLLCAAAEGMFDESVSCEQVEAEQEWRIQVQASSLEDLLQAWLSELLWVSERDDAAVCRIEMDSVQPKPWRARGRAWGGPPSPDAPRPGAPVKAVTYHDLQVWRDGSLWRARVVFDV
jgi:SHS2 domain-containing protein